MNFNATINIGDIISILLFSVTIITMHKRNIERLIQIEQRVNLMWHSFKQQFDLDDNGEHS